VIRFAALAGGLAGGVALSQFPEFSQQYLQRLGGQVDALAAVTQSFDASATKAGVTREAALTSMQGNDFLGFHQADTRATFTRFDRLSSDLTMQREAGPVERLFLPQRFDDAELLNATWGDFQPAVPATTAGLTTGAVGFAAGWVAVGALLSFLVRPFRRRVA
jgi:Protein of unknown function (DUF2937)